MYRHVIIEGRSFRCWLGKRQRQLYIETHLLSGSFGASVEADPGGEGDLKFFLGLIVLSLYVHISARWIAKLIRSYIKDYEDRSTGFRIFSGSIWWEVWHTTDSWSSRTPRWRHGNWDPMDSFFGRVKHREDEIVTCVTTVIPMPEGSYPCKVTIKRESFGRPRLPWRHRVTRAHVDCQTPVPYPGKGESEYDCGDDALYSMVTSASTVEQAIARAVESVLGRRRQYGGSVNWTQR
jgi:hypothetical protein